MRRRTLRARRSVNCDIGTGNLGSATVEEHAVSRKLRALSTLGNLGVNQSSPGFVPLGRTAVANCDEAREILSLPKEWKDRIVPQLDDGSGFKKHLEEQAAKAAAAPVN